MDSFVSRIIDESRKKGLDDYNILQRVKNYYQFGGDDDDITPTKEAPPTTEPTTTQRNEELQSVANDPLQMTGKTISSGGTLYHPSQDVRGFSKAMIFVPITKVLDRSKQRSFSVFFTPNLEYAKRFSGIWSLNKRPVYVHELRVKENITGIKQIDPKLLSDGIDVSEFSKNLCGPSEEGVINGIEITLPKKQENEELTEYYICNPERYFELVKTYMQFDANTWIEINPNKQEEQQ